LRAFSLLLLTILSISNSNAEIDISNIQSGNSVTQDWLGMPVIIYKRTKEEIKSTQNSTKPSINKGLYSRIKGDGTLFNSVAIVEYETIFLY